MTSKAIAEVLGIQDSTAYRHLANIRRTLQVRNSVEMLSVLQKVAKTNAASVRLTPRGAEVFTLIQSGISDKAIAERLGISYSAVRWHREKMLLQNNCRTMLELIAKNRGQRIEDTIAALK